MKITEKKQVEDCFDGSLIFELRLSGEITEEMILTLGKTGNLQYFPHFARPFFKLRVAGLYDLKGIEGNRTLRIHLKKPTEFSLENFADLLTEIK
ncbi:MAG: hypothetical protein CVV64_17145 [Candidatus Wallbacteria bacterium HGW-Wallbacteria-1]|jgi:hypothetical protein|uniref:Uncharacterized protein n=1 Tax=Candidatus Wallbacteria bacterium HGW-Wallbacteria-1 TaxID=2013854 RepID=A0A2N1PKF2_9BACT|nr:MAG: hypothetical protein CVV64_17145 [Candidatus Wallbacteria bacterium HGW-Wallbacteria-1]